MTRTAAGRRTVAGLLAVAACGLAAGCGGGREVSGGTQASATQTAPRAVIRQVPARVAAAFATFRSRPEGLPAGVFGALGWPRDDAGPRLAQRLPSTDGTAVWAVPGRARLCLMRQAADGGVSASCARIATAVERGIVLTSLVAAPSGSRVAVNRSVLGLMPDGTRHVRIATRGFATARSPVHDNAFTVRDAGTRPPHSVRLLR